MTIIINPGTGAADILEAIGVTVVDSKDYAAVQTALRALGKPRRRR